MALTQGQTANRVEKFQPVKKPLIVDSTGQEHSTPKLAPCLSQWAVPHIWRPTDM
jgi:hypothetical protein